DPQLLVDGVLLNPGDRLDGFYAVRDSTYFYLFWNINRADGRHETWLASAASDATSWQPPTRLKINTPDDMSIRAPVVNFFNSGFNTGTTFTASDGRDNVSWVKPAAGVFPVLPVAAQVSDQISVVFLREGHIVGYRPMNIGSKVTLVGTPNLV